jgi:hypothetical protein
VPDGLRIIAIHGVFYSGQVPMDDAAENWGITYPHVNDVDLETWDAYGLTTHPSYALINRDGSLYDSGAGRVESERTLRWIEEQLASQ